MIARSSLPLRAPASFATALAIGLSTTAAYGTFEGRSFAQVTERVTAQATFASRTSLQVSSQVLRFEVTDGSIPAETTIEFAAGARTRNDSEVVLAVRIPLEMSGMTVTVSGGTTTAVSKVVTRGESTVVARWVGGGLRIGHLQFQLRAAPGVYAIPVSFELNAL